MTTHRLSNAAWALLLTVVGGFVVVACSSDPALPEAAQDAAHPEDAQGSMSGSEDAQGTMSGSEDAQGTMSGSH